MYVWTLSMQEILVIALIILLLFGGKKIPERMRALERREEFQRRNERG